MNQTRKSLISTNDVSISQEKYKYSKVTSGVIEHLNKWIWESSKSGELANFQGCIVVP